MMVVKDELKIVVGAGEINNNPGWLHTNEDELNLLKREDWIKRFDSNSLEVILAEHVWEHLSYEEGVEAAKVCYEFLKNGGYIRCAVRIAFSRMKNIKKGYKLGDLDH